MSSFITELRPRRRAPSLGSAEARERWVHRRVGITWGLLFLNTLTFSSGTWNSLPLIVPIPTAIGKLLTQGALPVALLLALTVNRRIVIRPNVFLCLLSLLVVEAFVAGLHPAGHVIGTLYRTFRLAGFVATLWLLTPWWGRRDMLLLRCHLRWLYVGLGSVLLGILIAPGHALAQNGRLSGAIWPMFPTQIAQYAAVAAGLTVVLWLARLLSGRVTLAGVAVAVAILLLTHTRTALVGLVAGILVAGLSLFTINARVRKFFATGVIAVSIAVVTVAGVVSTWLARGENAQGLTTLTGRTNFWNLVLNLPRTRFQEIFGFGMTNASINGLPIDSNWLASYLMEGLFGVVVCAMILAFLFVAAFFQPHGVQRALALFLVTYCTVASYTEVSFTQASTYLLHLTVAASLLVMPLVGRRAA